MESQRRKYLIIILGIILFGLLVFLLIWSVISYPYKEFYIGLGWIYYPYTTYTIWTFPLLIIPLILIIYGISKNSLNRNLKITVGLFSATYIILFCFVPFLEAAVSPRDWIYILIDI